MKEKEKKEESQNFLGFSLIPISIAYSYYKDLLS